MNSQKIIYLTIDDGPSRHTCKIVDYLKDRNIPAIMFFCGEHIKNHYKNALYAVENDFVAGNHSYYHKYFSSISSENAISDIDKSENILDDLYKQAGKQRKYKLFRFPYGDKGYSWTKLSVVFKKLNAKYRLLQEHLASINYHKFDIDNLQANFYYKLLLDDIDMFWTFDTNDWQLGNSECPNFGYQELDNLLGKLKNRPKDEILLMHDRDDTPEYFFYIIDKLIGEEYSFSLPA